LRLRVEGLCDDRLALRLDDRAKELTQRSTSSRGRPTSNITSITQKAALAR
jgi:hypothetical protein